MNTATHLSGSGLEYRPVKGVKYTPSLGEEYDRDKVILSKQAANIREKGQQEIAKGAAQDQLIMAIGSLIPKFAKEAKLQKAKSKKKVSQQLASRNYSTDQINEWHKIRDEFTDKGQQLKALVSTELFEGNEDAAKYLTDLSPDQIVYAKEFYSGRTAQQLPLTWQHDSLAQARFKEIKTAEAKQAFLYEWAGEQFGPNVLNDGILFDTATATIDKWVGTQVASNAKNLKNNYLAAEDLKWSQQIDLAVKGDNLDHLGTTLQDQINLEKVFWKNKGYGDGTDGKETATQKATKIVLGRLTKLASQRDADGNPYLSLAEIEAFDIAPVKDHAGGKTVGKAFFPKGFKDQLRATHKAAWNETLKERDKVRTIDISNSVLTALDKYKDPANYDKGAIQNEINILTSLGAKAETLKPLQQMLNSNQSTEDYETQKTEWAPRMNQIHKYKDEIDKTSNITLRQELEGAYEERIKLMDKHGFKVNTKGEVLGSSEFIKSGLSRTLEPNQKLEGNGLRALKIYNDRVFDEYSSILNENPDNPNPNAFSLAEAAAKKWAISEGYGKTTSDEGFKNGIFATTVDGDFVNIDEINVDKATGWGETFALPTVENKKLWAQETANAFKEAKKKRQPEESLQTIVLNTSESLASRHDLLGYALYGKVSIELQNKFKAAQVSVSKGLRMQLQALVNKSEAKDAPEELKAFVDRHNLDKFEFPEDINTIEKLLEKNKDVNYLLKFKTFDELSPNQIQQVEKNLIPEILNAFDLKKEQKALDEQDTKRKAKQKEKDDLLKEQADLNEKIRKAKRELIINSAESLSKAFSDGASILNNTPTQQPYGLGPA